MNGSKAVVRLGINLGKNSFHLWGVNEQDERVLKKPVRRSGLMRKVAKWRRSSSRAMSRATKNDYQDAEAIGEAVARTNMRFVAVKTVEQQDLQAMHQIRPAAVWARRRPGQAGRNRDMQGASSYRPGGKRSWGEGDLERHTRFFHLVPLSAETGDLAVSWVCSRKRPAVPRTSSM